MRKIVTLLLIVLVVFVAINRLRVFVWDPLAKVTRDGTAQPEVRVMINYANDVLLDDGTDAAQHRLYVVQHWDMAARYPTGVHYCLKYLACLSDADQASGLPIVSEAKGSNPSSAGVTMTDRQVEFTDAAGARVQVQLR